MACKNFGTNNKKVEMTLLEFIKKYPTYPTELLVNKILKEFLSVTNELFSN